MNLFFILLGKIFPLYLNILLGYLLTRFLGIKREHIAFILIYILGPFVIFFATLSVKINLQSIFLPLFVFFFGSFLAFFTLFKYKAYWNDASLNTLAFTNGTGNTGYFGIPLAMILLEPNLANLFIFATMASLLYENTTGFYVTAKSNFSALDSFKKVLKLPLVYAFILGITLNLQGIQLPENILPFVEILKWCYGILGMMLLGMAIKGFNISHDFDIKYIRIAYFYKFFIWPATVLIITVLDSIYFHFLNNDIYKVLFLFSIVPLAGNTVTLAILLNAKPEKASFTVLLSTLISVVYIPVALSTFYLFF